MPAGQALCEPSQHCMVRLRCGRVHAMPTGKAEVRDYSAEPDGGSALCEGFVHMQQVMVEEMRW